MVIRFDVTDPSTVRTSRVIVLAVRRDHSKAPVSLIRMSVEPCRKPDWPPSRIHGRSTVPDPRFERPVTVTMVAPRARSRVPEMTMLARAAACGATSREGADHGPQPAPLRARTLNVYAVPFVSPVISQERAVVRQLPPDGDDVTW